MATVSINIQSSRQAAQIHGCKVLVYGEAGSGKTRLCASAPNPFIISAEHGLLSLRDFDIPTVKVNTIADLANVFMWLTQSKEARKFDTICLDSMSEIAEKVFSEEMKRTADPRKLYPKVQEQVVSAFRSFRDISGKHIALLAKCGNTQDAAGIRKYLPEFPGQKLAQAAPYFTDEVFYLHTFDDMNNAYGMGQGYKWRLLRTQPSIEYTAKDRSGRLNELEDADPKTGGGLATIFRKMMS